MSESLLRNKIADAVVDVLGAQRSTAVQIATLHQISARVLAIPEIADAKARIRTLEEALRMAQMGLDEMARFDCREDAGDRHARNDCCANPKRPIPCHHGVVRKTIAAISDVLSERASITSAPARSATHSAP